MDFNRRRLNPEVMRDRTMANTFYDQLQKAINHEMEHLGKMEQVAVYYQGPSGAPLLVAGLGYHNPYLIKLYCKNERDEQRVVLAHMNSVQLLLAVEKVEIRSPKRTIGFVGQSSPDANDEASGSR
jgi:hypothetical protein